MKEQFVTYEIALKLKELGFNESCFGYYEVSDKLKGGFKIRFIEHEDSNPSKQPLNEGCLAPLWQQAIDWFREKHNLSIDIYSVSGFSTLKYSWNILTKNNVFQTNTFKIGRDNNLHKIREQAILKAIELCKKDK